VSIASEGPDENGGKRIARDPETGRIRPGSTLNPKGRPKGARSRLSDAFFQALAEVWEAQGMDAMIKTATDEPATFVRVAASLMPKQVQEVAEDQLASLSEEDVDAVIELARKARQTEGA
jgi:hypothetical protein